MVSMAIDNNLKSRTSAFSQVPVMSFEKDGHYPMAMDTSTSSNSAILASPDKVPNFTVHTGRQNNNKKDNNTNVINIIGNSNSNSNSYSNTSNNNIKGIIPTSTNNSNNIYSVNTGNQERRDLHVRQNFGKDQGYVPPQTKESRFTVQSLRPNTFGGSERSTPQENESTGSEVPFDVLNTMIIRDRSTDAIRIPPEPKSPPKIARSASETRYYEADATQSDFEDLWENASPSDPANQFDGDRGRFTIPPLKVSNPTPLPVVEVPITPKRDYRVRASGKVEKSRKKEPTSPQNDYEEFGLSPASNATNDSTLEILSETPVAPILRNAQHVLDPSRANAPQDEDSLFDFEEEVDAQFPDPQHKLVKVTHKMRRRNRTTRDIKEDTEDTSIECSAVNKRPSPTTLQERAAEAWKVRRGKVSSLRTKNTPPKKTSNVSFGKTATVHHFQPEPQSSQDENEDETTVQSMEDRSLNSEYTKTLESEVEDMIKDILFIGSGKSSGPGRRKLKHKPEIKRKLRRRKMEEADKRQDDVGLGNDNAAASPRFRVKVYPEERRRDSPSQGSNAAVRSAPNSDAASATTASASIADDGDPFVAIWGFVEGGVNAMSSVLGLNEDPSKKQTAVAKSKENSSPKSKNVPPQSAGAGAAKGATEGNCNEQIFPIFGDGVCPGSILHNSDTRTQMSAMKDVPSWYSEADVEDGSASSYDSKSMDYDDDRTDDRTDDESKVPFNPVSMDRDPRIMQLALQAAKSFHKLKGLQYDESILIDMFSDVKMRVVELKLPLGLIFLENEGGCFVTKIAPDGSAARSGGVEVGDQLAAINGMVCLNMKVGDICKIIPKDTKQKMVELVLLRYVGPLRPANKNSSWDSFDVVERNGSFDGSYEGQEVLARVPKQAEKESKGKRIFRLFGRGKKKGSKR